MSDKREEQFHQKRNALTSEDMENLVSMFRSVIETRDNNHPCRFPSINPDDLRAMVETHKSLHTALTDSKKVVRRFFIVIFLSAATGLTIGGFWAKVKQLVEEAIK